MAAVFISGTPSATAAADCPVLICNVTERGFVVAWTSSAPVTGYVQYGTDPGALDMIACDVRDGGPPCDLVSDTHFVEIGSLTPGTSYFFEVIEDGTSSGTVCDVMTGPALAPMLPDTRYGQVFEPDGASYATGAFVTYRIRRGLGRSELACDLIATEGDQGYWSLDRASVRSENGGDYFGGAPGDWEREIAYGGMSGCAKQIVPYDDPNPSPSMLLGSCPCAPVPVDTPFAVARTLNKRSLGTFFEIDIRFGNGWNVAAVDARFPIELRVAGGAPLADLERELRGTSLIVRYSRSDVQNAAPIGERVRLSVSGLFADGCDFAGEDFIRVIDEGQVHQNAQSEDDPSTILDDAERGLVSKLGAGGDGDLGPTDCLPGYLSNFDFTLNTDPELPPPGDSFFYLYRFCGGTPDCTLGTSSSGTTRAPSSGGCP